MAVNPIACEFLNIIIPGAMMTIPREITIIPEAALRGNLDRPHITNKMNAKRIRRGCMKEDRDMLKAAMNSSRLNRDFLSQRENFISEATEIKMKDAVGSSYPIAIVLSARVGLTVSTSAMGYEKFTNLVWRNSSTKKAQAMK
jgi:hypothetical protein